MATLTAPSAVDQHDTFPINGTDYIELFVGNAKQASLYYRAAFGFQLIAYRGPETGVRDRASYLLVQDKIRFVLTTPLSPDGEIAAHILRHGDGVKDLAFWVDDAREAYAKALERGAVSVHEPRVVTDKDGEVVIVTAESGAPHILLPVIGKLWPVNIVRMRLEGDLLTVELDGWSDYQIHVTPLQ